VVVNCSYCTPDDGYGKYPKHVEWSCNKIKILVLHLVGHFVCIYIENDARNHEPKIQWDVRFLQRCCWRSMSSGTEVYLHCWVNIHRHFERWHCLIFKVKQSSWTLCAGTGITFWGWQNISTLPRRGTLKAQENISILNILVSKLASRNTASEMMMPTCVCWHHVNVKSGKEKNVHETRQCILRKHRV
jgi:hypothetical protein